MGSGSSRSSRALKRLRGPDSRPLGPGGTAAEGGPGPLGRAAAEAPAEAPRAVAGAEGAPSRDPGPAAPPDGGDETLRLLDQLLAESATWDPGEAASRRPARPRAARGAGSLVTPKQSTEDSPESGSVSQVPSSSHKHPERQSAIAYDYSEEELMASIEREYGR